MLLRQTIGYHYGISRFLRYTIVKGDKYQEQRMKEIYGKLYRIGRKAKNEEYRYSFVGFDFGWERSQRSLMAIDKEELTETQKEENYIIELFIDLAIDGFEEVFNSGLSMESFFQRNLPSKDPEEEVYERFRTEYAQILTYYLKRNSALATALVEYYKSSKYRINEAEVGELVIVVSANAGWGRMEPGQLARVEKKNRFSYQLNSHAYGANWTVHTDMSADDFSFENEEFNFSEQVDYKLLFIPLKDFLEFCKEYSNSGGIVLLQFKDPLTESLRKKEGLTVSEPTTIEEESSYITPPLSHRSFAPED